MWFLFLTLINKSQHDKLGAKYNDIWIFTTPCIKTGHLLPYISKETIIYYKRTQYSIKQPTKNYQATLFFIGHVNFGVVYPVTLDDKSLKCRVFMHDFVFTYLSFYLQTLFHFSTILTLLTFTSNIKIFLFNLFLMYCFVYSPQGCQLPHCHPLTYPLPGLARGGAGNSCGNIVATLVC